MLAHELDPIVSRDNVPARQLLTRFALGAQPVAVHRNFHRKELRDERAEVVAEAAAQPWAASITCSKSTESHVGAVIHGQIASEGYTGEELHAALAVAVERGYIASLVHLNKVCGTDARAACVLVIRGASSLLAGASLEDLQHEYQNIIWPRLDRHLASYGTVKNKHARGNAELGPQDIAGNYKDFAPGEKIAGRPVSGRVIAFSRVPLHAALTRGWRRLIPKANDLLAEVNHYGPAYPHNDVPDNNRSHRFNQTGIGFHGDSERPDVACLCIGNQRKELHFQPFQGKEPEGGRCVITLHPGDAYVMCEAACGFRWKTELRNPAVIHYRHAAGAPGECQWTPSSETIRLTIHQKQIAKRKREAKQEESQQM